MNPRVFKPKSKDLDYLDKYQMVLDDVGTLHRYAVEWVKKQNVFEDERAIHAMAVSIKIDVMKLMDIPNLVAYTPAKDPKQNLIDFQLYRQTVDDQREAFIQLTAEAYNLDEDAVRMAIDEMNIIMKGQVFTWKHYDLMAEGIERYLDSDLAGAREKWLEAGGGS